MLPAVGLPDLEGEVPVQVQGQGGAGFGPLQDGDLPPQHQGAGPVVRKKGRASK